MNKILISEEHKSYKPIINTTTEEKDIIVSLRHLFPIGRAPIDVYDFIGQVEAVYRGLGIPVLYSVLSMLANKSVFFIGGRGVGKTRMINCIPDIEGIESSKWDTFTLEELNNYCSKFSDFTDTVHDKHFAFKVEEFSTLSEYHREIFLTVCSKIITDGSYRHITRRTPDLNIQNCKLTLLIAIQPKLYSLLCNRYTQWESMSYDRFTKFILLNPLRDKTLDVPLVPTLPRKITDSPSLQDIDLSKLVELFSGHVSEGRAYIYARDYATAMARFLGKDKVQQEHVNTFYKLFSPYLEAFSRLQQREDLESAITISSGNLELLTEIGKHPEGATKQQLSNSLMVSERHIERCISFLLSKKLIRRDKSNYRLSTELEQFFDWYKSEFSS